eukprot:6160439-Prymnesium_polylepis.1
MASGSGTNGGTTIGGARASGLSRCLALPSWRIFSCITGMALLEPALAARRWPAPGGATLGGGARLACEGMRGAGGRHWVRLGLGVRG